MPFRFLGTIVLTVAVATSAAAEQLPLYRIFLQDGTSLVSYGEYARMADRVVFALPVGTLEPNPRLQTVTIAEDKVDWGKTEEYTESVRARRYAETRGEADFAILSSQVAAALNDVAVTKDPAIRLAMAEEARKKLAAWPKENYGYRAADVTQLLWLFDDVVSELRAAAGLPRYDITLYAATPPPAPRELLAAPDFRVSMEQAFSVASVAEDAPERMSLLRAIAASLKPTGGAEWETALHAKALSALLAEHKISNAYTDLTSKTVAAAAHRARRADVIGLQQLIRSVLETDDRLGRLRPGETSALLALLDTRVDEARRLRLARDAFQLRAGVLKAYRAKAHVAIRQVVRSMRWIEAIRELAGPAPRSLHLLESRMRAASRAVSALKPPAEVVNGHSMLTTAIAMVTRAAATRRQAATRGDMSVAWEASAAAAGALLMFEQAVDEINKQTSIPQLR